MSEDRLYVCNVANHPILERNAFYELHNGNVQQIEHRQEGTQVKMGAYVGLLYPWALVSDGLVEVRNQGYSG